MAADIDYWCAKHPDELVRLLDEKTDRFYEWLRTSGQINLWLKMLDQYYSGIVTEGELGVYGEQDEYTTVRANHLHNIGEHIVTMVTSSRPHFEPKARNSDHESASQAIIAAGLLEMVHRDKDLEAVAIDVTRYALLFSEAWGTVIWNPNGGGDVAVNPDGGEIAKTGDISYDAFMPIDVIRDPTKDNARSHVWLQTREAVNRWELLAKYRNPEQQAAILDLPSALEDEQRRPRLTKALAGTRHFDSDDVWLYRWYHDKTPALPSGRCMEWVSAAQGGWLFDGPLQYEQIPVVRMAPEELPGSQRGYTGTFDLLALQHMASSCKSLTLSHINNFGTGVWWTPSGSTLTAEDVSGGFKLIKGGQIAPVPLQPPQLPAVIPETEQQTVTDMETISGVNAVIRGNPEESLGKGAPAQALALLDAKSLQFQQGLQRGWVKWMESVAMMTIRHYRTFLQYPQVVLMAGKANRSIAKEFSGDTFTGIERVAVDIGNPMTRTIAGRMNIAEMLLQMPQSPIKTPEELQQVLATGRLEPAIEGVQAELLNIRAENELLMDAQPAMAAATDNHPMHMREHAAVIASPEARSTPQVVQAVMMHMTEHSNLWRTTDPTILMALGVPPPPMMQPGMGPPGAAPPGPPGAAPGPAAALQPNGQGPDVSLPNPPPQPNGDPAATMGMGAA